MTPNIMPRIIVLLIVSGTVLSGCQGPPYSYRGTTIAEDRQIILLEGGPHNGRLQTWDVVVTYTYHRAQADLRLTGKVDIRYRNSVFRLSAHWADCDGVILADRELLSSGTARNKNRFQFSADQRLPQFACKMGFSYNGTAYDTAFESGAKQFRLAP